MVETRSQHLRRMTGVAWKGVESAQCVFIDILSRLSVRSIRSFKRRVSKYWDSSISSKQLPKKHLSQSRKKPRYIICPSMDDTMELYLLTPRRFNFQHLATVDPSGRSNKPFMYMISCFNGLVCCISGQSVEYEDHLHDLEIWICNPATEDTLLLPQGRPSIGTEPCIGVAYGPDMSEYKVFRIFCAGEKNPGEAVVYDDESPEDDAFFYECEVYSSSTGGWRNIGPVPHLPIPVCFSPHKSSHVFAGGKIYWLVSLEDSGKILSVDMEERFEVMELPEYHEDLPDEDRITIATYLLNLGGSLSLVILHADYMDIWVRESSSWVLVSVDEFPFDGDEAVLSITSSEKEILFATGTHLWTYDLDTRGWKERSKAPTEFCNPAMFPFTESLLPCGGVRLEGRCEE